MNCAAKLFSLLLKIFQVIMAITISVETRITIVSSLYDVPRDSGNGKTGSSRHIGILPMINIPLR
jgi:hypothetical protein